VSSPPSAPSAPSAGPPARARKPASGHTHTHGHSHRDVSGGWLRPAVFGAMDGLVSNVSLISGVAGGSASVHTVRLAGLAGLVAGAFSMATGEYTSVRSQTEAMHAEIAVERRELARAPRAEAAELERVFRRRGVEPRLAAQVVSQMSQDRDVALKVHVQEELGVDVDNLPSPWVAAGSSLAAFAVGALIPVLPYLAGATVLWISLLVSALALFVAGAAVSRFTTRTAVYGGARQLLLGAGAAAVTFGVGHLVGGTVG
jgi:vacuolar iron transporter family protein